MFWSSIIQNCIFVCTFLNSGTRYLYLHVSCEKIRQKDVMILIQFYLRALFEYKSFYWIIENVWNRSNWELHILLSYLAYLLFHRKHLQPHSCHSNTSKRLSLATNIYKYPNDALNNWKYDYKGDNGKRLLLQKLKLASTLAVKKYKSNN